jgi:chromate transport protein ChrA
MSALYFTHAQGPHMSAVLRGMGAAVVGFVCVTVLRIGRGALGSRGGVWVGLLTFAAVGLFRLNALTVLLVGIPISVWLNRPGRAQTLARAEPGR